MLSTWMLRAYRDEDTWGAKKTTGALHPVKFKNLQLLTSRSDRRELSCSELSDLYEKSKMKQVCWQSTADDGQSSLSQYNKASGLFSLPDPLPLDGEGTGHRGTL